MASPPRIPLDLLASEDADLSPSLSLRPRDSGLLPGREAIEASLGALGAQAALALSFFGDMTMPTVDITANSAANVERQSAGSTPTALGTEDPDIPTTGLAGDIDIADEAVTQTAGDLEPASVPGWTVPNLPTDGSASPRTALARSYLPVEEIGRGGMGIVYRARQTVLHRDIAVKAARFATDETRAIKFISEALLTASLEHPNIVPVHDLTTTPDQRLALAMKLIGGTTWRALLRGEVDERAHIAREEVDLEYHLDVLMSVANALAFAHSKYIIHCDIKPANVLIGEFGEVLLVDWGIAFDFHDDKRADSPAPHCSDLHTPCGTPQYIAPELARGAGAELGPWTDIFLLGAVLHEVLTGKPPHQGGSAAEVLWQAVAWSGPDFSDVAPDREIPETLAAICARAMAPDPEDRYQTVAEFQDDLRAFLDHRQSLMITAHAADKLAACLVRDAQVGVGDRQGRNRLYSEFADAVAGFREARVLWPENPQAIAGEREARVAFGRSAMEHNDLGLAEAQLEMLEGDVPEAQALIDEVHQAQDTRRRARAQTRRLWTALSITAIVIIGGLAFAYVLIDREHKSAVASRNLAEGRLADIQRLADVQRVVELQEQHQTLWPATPENAAGMDTWLASASELTRHLADHEAYLASLRARAASRSDEHYRFEQATDQWEHDTLAGLVTDIRALDTDLIPTMRDRVAFARSAHEQSIGKYRDRWAEARAAIAASEHYRGLTIEPQIGLVPIGPDRRSGLWEFAHIQTGAIPERDADGAIARTEDMAIVLVLLPGGSFSMGAHPPSDQHPVGSPNVDTGVGASEQPVHTVALEPFFLAKYEMTQGQWQRFTHSNPSAYPPGKEIGGKTHDARHPVEMVRWEQSYRVVTQLGLTLPTEAQWEYGARAGTSTVYPTGEDKLSLRGSLNMADAYCQEHGGPGSWRYETWLNDGYVVHAPVGSYRANGFGLHDMVGNVWEWCLDRYGPYSAAVKPGTGERAAPADAPHVFRGGGFRSNVVHARSADRYSLYAPSYRGYDVGLRPARRLD